MKKVVFFLSLVCFAMLSATAQNWTVTGTVTSSNTQQPVANKTVQIMYPDSLSGNPYYASTTTNASGQYSFTNLPAINGSLPYSIMVSDCQGYTQYGYAQANNAVVDFSICTQVVNPCQANFLAVQDSIAVNTFYFIDQSQGNPTSWSWDFGDGNTSTQQHPTHVYTTTGTYTVTLSISGTNCQSVDTIQVVVGNVSPCHAAFSYTVSPNNPNQVTFINQSVSTNPGTPSYIWYFNDGTGTTSTLENPVYTFANPGTYHVVLAVTNGNCFDSISMVITIQNPAPCNPAFWYFQDSLSSGFVYHFSDASSGNPTSWSWDFGDGNTSTQQHPTHTYAAPGTYNVTLTVSGGTCQNATTTQTIQVSQGGSGVCLASFAAYVDSTNALTYYFNDQSIGNPTSWTWDFGDGTISTQQYPTHTYAAAGTYTVSLTINGTNCQSASTSTITLNVNNGPANLYQISGTIYADQNPVHLAQVLVFNAITGSLQYQTVSDQSGNYTITNVPNGMFVVAAFPDTGCSVLNTHTFTYLGDALNWSNATVLSMTQNMTQQNINLQAIVVVPGNGQVSGNVGNGTKAGVADAAVYLLDASNQVVATTETATNGDYNFTAVANGDFHIWVNIPGYTATPKQVNLSSSNTQSTDNNFMVSGNTIAPVTTGISNPVEIEISNAFPNPVTDFLTVEISNPAKEAVIVKLYSLSGQLLLSENVARDETTTRLNMQDLQQGSYLLIVHNENGSSTRKLVTKM